MSIRMKKQTTTASVRRSKSGDLAEVQLRLLVPATKIKNVTKVLEGVAALMPPLGAWRLQDAGTKLPASWGLNFKNKGHEIKVVTSEGEKVLNAENTRDISSADAPVAAEAKHTAPSAKAPKEKRFNKFGEEVVSLSDIFPDRHPGMVLKGFRQRDNLTQQQLADLLKIGQSRVCDWENGVRAISKAMAERLAKVFNISYRAFL
jgi:DNA-binding transcriptional regulator YiaG